MSGSSGFGRLRVNEARLAALSGSERAEAVRALRLLDELRERNPLQFFRPYRKQEEFLASTARTKAFFGGNRAGKTEVGIADDLIQCVDGGCLPERLRGFKRWEPPFRCRIVTQGFGPNDAVVLDKLRALAPKDQLLGGTWRRAFKQEAIPILRFENGSFIQFLTSQQDVAMHAGSALHRVHLDEEPPGEHGFQIYRENRQRLIDFRGQMMVTMTPLLGLSWAYDELWERRDEAGRFCIVASALDNPFLPREILEEEMRGMSREERQARIEGLFVHFHGRVLEGFDPARHVVDPIGREDLEGQEVYVGIDPGISRGGVVWAAFDRDDRMLVFDEFYPSGLSVPQVAAAISKRNHRWGLTHAKVSYVIDPSARNRSHTDAQNVESLFAARGIFCTHGQNDRVTGILQLKARIEADALLVCRNCEDWLRERERWVVASDEESGKGDRFVTRGPDHLMDPTRYVAMERTWFTPERPREERRAAFDPTYEGPWVPVEEIESAPLGALS